MNDMGWHQVPAGPRLHIDDAGGTGLPVLFQHGLCGDAQQTREAFPTDAAYRRITIEARGHGGSEAGDLSEFSIAAFADDFASWISASGLAPIVVGGISMGAAIALRLAVTRPELVKGLILARPAWVVVAAPDNMRPNAEVGALLSAFTQAEAQKRFTATETAMQLASNAPDNLASLIRFFTRAPQTDTAALLQAISADGPGVTEKQVQALRLPTLVIGHRQDSVHPLTHATTLGAMIPDFKFVEITPKSVDKGRYIADFHAAIHAFLKDL